MEPCRRWRGRYGCDRDNFTQTARLARLLTNRPEVADDLGQDAFVLRTDTP